MRRFPFHECFDVVKQRVSLAESLYPRNLMEAHFLLFSLHEIHIDVCSSISWFSVCSVVLCTLCTNH
jgi:hypothetical protein